ncbi:MAG: GNAT family N-acetyltransferase [Arenimonas sp.]|jgi:predicted GNAT superfamily acetyltransferase|uniref:GNAT family N-acetyltransferase n=1 Tax=Arenimonas sp. TaxID=1872635 RepID=UPI001B7314AE|nr:GNAT family N-acetyltransferase [Arenimonas sp.]
MSISIRDAQAHELDAILAMNNAAGSGILPMNQGQIHYFWQHADYFRVAESDDCLVGFLIAMTRDADYESSNFRWFKDHYDAFVYVDRIVIANGQRSAGIGRLFYADVQSFAEMRAPALVAEVFIEDSTHPALLFHGSFGFHEVGQHQLPDSPLRAAMLYKDLCSYPFVLATYGVQLPPVDWLQARVKPQPSGHLATGT